MKASKIALSLSLISLFGCPAEDAPIGPPIERPKNPANVIALPSMPVDHPDIASLDVLSRGPRRMSVEQLERSVEVIIGGIPEGQFNLDRTLALTLGEPDYLTVTEESLEPTPLYMKFMMDLGAYVCQAVRDYDPQRPVEERVLTRYADQDQNIRYILLRFTGIDGPAADPYVERLARVYAAGRSGPLGDASGWEAVCLAVFTSPEFLLY
jgi:hypothetical protein